jgi:EAL domain-containing protein (putative c-di-GMP-specific phosphodiesterase class I)
MISILLANELSWAVVAEGVENMKTCEQLKALGVNIIQGYFFSKPIAGDSILGFIADLHALDQHSISKFQKEKLENSLKTHI